MKRRAADDDGSDDVLVGEQVGQTCGESKVEQRREATGWFAGRRHVDALVAQTEGRNATGAKGDELCTGLGVKRIAIVRHRQSSLLAGRGREDDLVRKASKFTRMRRDVHDQDGVAERILGRPVAHSLFDGGLQRTLKADRDT